MNPYRSEHDVNTACVIAQQYSFATFVSLRFHTHEEEIRLSFQMYYFIYYLRLL